MVNPLSLKKGAELRAKFKLVKTTISAVSCLRISISKVADFFFLFTAAAILVPLVSTPTTTVMVCV